MLTNTYKNHHWAVVLAGGDGERLKELTQLVSGESRPKQFCPFFGGRSLLAHTRERIAPLFSQDRTLFALSRGHQGFYRHEMHDVAGYRKIVQPVNRGTAVAIALCLRRILQQDPDAVVTFLPSDHHYLDDAAFQTTVERGLESVEQHPQSALLVGARPAYAEVEYGWIEPGPTLLDCSVRPVHRVSRFWEKPEQRQAEQLLDLGCLWNTFVTMGSADTLLELLAASLPQIAEAFGSEHLDRNLDLIYRSVPSTDFSKAVLSHVPNRLLVIEDAASGWTDLGTPRRLVGALTNGGSTPAWLSAHGNETWERSGTPRFAQRTPQRGWAGDCFPLPAGSWRADPLAAGLIGFETAKQDVHEGRTCWIF